MNTLTTVTHLIPSTVVGSRSHTDTTLPRPGNHGSFPVWGPSINSLTPVCVRTRKLWNFLFTFLIGSGLVDFFGTQTLQTPFYITFARVNATLSKQTKCVSVSVSTWCRKSFVQIFILDVQYPTLSRRLGRSVSSRCHPIRSTKFLQRVLSTQYPSVS